MIAVLLCAGFATRMYPLTIGFPKSLLPVAGKPALDYLVDQIVSLPHIDEIHLITNAKFADRFRRWRRSRINRSGRDPIDIIVHNDGATAAENRLGACTDLQLVFGRTSFTGPVLVSAGDNIYLFDVGKLWAQFLSGRSHRIVALAEANEHDLKKSGVPVFGDGNRVIRLLEKPTHPPSGWLCPPLYFLQPSARKALDEFLETCGPVDAPGFFIDFLCRNDTVTAFKIDGRRLDIGSPETYREADRLMRLVPQETARY